MRRDIAYVPATDLYGNLTTGYQSFAGGDTYPSGNPYVGQIRVDTPTAVVTASLNAADNQATTIRNDANLVPVIYAIGLGGTSAEPIDLQPASSMRPSHNVISSCCGQPPANASAVSRTRSTISRALR
jgi:hypothetical protein